MPEGLPTHRRAARFVLLVLLVLALLSLPFVLFGEAFATRILGAHEWPGWVLAGLGVILLTADSLAPIPSAVVIVAVALKAGWIVGTISGTLGLCGQVVGAAWFGRVALSRIATRTLGLASGEQLHTALQQRLTLTLGCVRGVPLLAETSVAVAASLGVPLRLICRATVLPNFAIAATYSIAAQAGLGVAAAAVVASFAVSYLLWRRAVPDAAR